MAIDFEGHRKALHAAMNLMGALRDRGSVYDVPERHKFLAGLIREEWARLQEAMPGVLAELPGATEATDEPRGSAALGGHDGD